ncbi:MAG TPA: 1-deoxy-D-xylulose-5-phosphate synthase N-terminal domain-containing protein, partial [Stellaceae bacterium]|nr:1-deoxy-D-xylulose-5-phosphate synthase N-terminal domain-containing protein [Stellaceae bacterium]
MTDQNGNDAPHHRRDNIRSLLDGIESPADLRRLGEGDLGALAAELRAELIDAVSVTGG